MFGYFYLASVNSLEASKGKWKVLINHGSNLAMLIQGDKRAKVICKVAIIICSTESKLIFLKKKETNNMKTSEKIIRPRYCRSQCAELFQAHLVYFLHLP